MTTTTTTKFAALLPAETLTRQTITARAASRHPLTPCPCWYTTPDGVTVPDIDTAAAYVMTLADRATFYALRARHEKSGVQMFADLMNQTKSDQTARRMTEHGTAALIAEREHAAAVERITIFDSIAHSQTASPADVIAASIAAEQERQTRNTARQHADSHNAIISNATASDREQLVQAAALWAVEHWDEVTADPAGIVRGMTNAAGRAIAELAAPDALRSTRTKWTPITPEQAANERAAHPDITTIDPTTGEETTTPAKIPFTVREGTAAGYYQIEYTEGSKPRKDGTQSRPAGWYKVSHYHTAAPYISYEVFVDGNPAAIVKNDGINAITNQTAAEEVAALADRANLTAKEREVISKLTDNTARAAAEQAHHEATEKGRDSVAAASKDHKARARARATATAEAAYTAALWDSAFQRSGIYAKSTRHDIRSRITTALDKARTAPEQLTAEEQEEATRRHWEREQRSRTRYRQRGQQESRPDIITAYSRAAATLGALKPVISWSESGHAPQTLTPEEVKAEATARERERLEYIASHAADIARLNHRRQTYTSPRQTLTPWNALDAQAAARVFWDSFTPAEQDESIQAYKAEQAAEAAARAEQERRKAFPRWVYGLNTTFEIWSKASEEERQEHRHYLDSLSRQH